MSLEGVTILLMARPNKSNRIQVFTCLLEITRVNYYQSHDKLKLTFHTISTRLLILGSC